MGVKFTDGKVTPRSYSDLRTFPFLTPRRIRRESVTPTPVVTLHLGTTDTRLESAGPEFSKTPVPTGSGDGTDYTPSVGKRCPFPLRVSPSWTGLRHKEFIEFNVSLVKGLTCPFCGRRLVTTRCCGDSHHVSTRRCFNSGYMVLGLGRDRDLSHVSRAGRFRRSVSTHSGVEDPCVPDPSSPSRVDGRSNEIRGLGF